MSDCARQIESLPYEQRSNASYRLNSILMIDICIIFVVIFLHDLLRQATLRVDGHLWQAAYTEATFRAHLELKRVAAHIKASWS